MYKLRSVCLLGLFLVISWLGADLRAENNSASDPSAGDYIIRVEGFQQYPDTQFFQVSEQNAAIKVKRIRTNSVSYYNGLNRNTTRISYNPKLNDLKENESYPVKDIGLILDDDLYFEADPVIVNRSGGLEGFSTITDYFKIKAVPATTGKDDIEFTTDFYKRIYATTDYTIAATEDFNAIPDFIKNAITMNSLQVIGSKLRFSPAQLSTLRTFVSTKNSTHHINGAGVKLDEETEYARQNTRIQNIRFASNTPPIPAKPEHHGATYKSARIDTTFGTNPHKPWKDSYAHKFWIALLCSILVQGIVMIMLSLKNLDFKVSEWEMSGAVFLITAFGTGITVPIMWWVFILFGLPHSMYVLVSETFAILAEGWWFALMLRIPFKKAFTFSLVANLASWWISIFIFDYMLDWIL